MNRKSTLAMLLAAIMACLGANAETITPSNRYITRKVNTGNFTAIRTNTAVDVVYSAGAKSVEIYAPDNLIDFIEVEADGDELRINYTDNVNIQGNHESSVKVSAPAVTRFTTASAGNIVIKSPIRQKGASVSLTVLSAGFIKAGAIEAADVSLSTNSAGDILVGDITADVAILKANSAGDISTGSIATKENTEIYANSAGDIKVPEIVAGMKAEVSANSAGDIEISSINAETSSLYSNSTGEINAKDIKSTSVNARANSMGRVTIAGNCANADLGAYSLGDINARNLKANHVSATVRSKGNITCQPLQTLNASRSGTGKIQYAGNPSTVNVNDYKEGGVTKL